MKNKMKLWFGSLLALLILVPTVSAFGISSPYWSDNPLFLEPGASRDVTLSLQNMLGGEDMIIQAEIKAGNDIATMLSGSEIYEVDFGNRHVPVDLRLSIPSSAKLGDSYTVVLSFKEVKEDEGGFVGLSSAVTTNLPIVVGTESSPEVDIQLPAPEEPGSNYLLVGLILIGLIAVVAYVYKKRR